MALGNVHGHEERKATTQGVLTAGRRQSPGLELADPASERRDPFVNEFYEYQNNLSPACIRSWMRRTSAGRQTMRAVITTSPLPTLHSYRTQELWLCYRLRRGSAYKTVFSVGRRAVQHQASLRVPYLPECACIRVY